MENLTRKMEICAKCKHIINRWVSGMSDIDPSVNLASCILEEAPESAFKIDAISGEKLFKDENHDYIITDVSKKRWKGDLRWLLACRKKNADGKCKDWEAIKEQKL